MKDVQGGKALQVADVWDPRSAALARRGAWPLQSPGPARAAKPRRR